MAGLAPQGPQSTSGLSSDSSRACSKAQTISNITAPLPSAGGKARPSSDAGCAVNRSRVGTRTPLPQHRPNVTVTSPTSRESRLAAMRAATVRQIVSRNGAPEKVRMSTSHSTSWRSSRRRTSVGEE